VKRMTLYDIVREMYQDTSTVSRAPNSMARRAGFVLEWTSRLRSC